MKLYKRTYKNNIIFKKLNTNILKAKIEKRKKNYSLENNYMSTERTKITVLIFSNTQASKKKNLIATPLNFV